MGRPGLSNHPKFRRLAQVLGSAALARGHLELLWEVAYENGDPVLGDPVAVEACAQWAGPRGELHEALRDAGGPGRVGFIDERNGVWEVHDLYDHAPEYVRKRAAREASRRTTGRTLDAERRKTAADGGRTADNGGHRSPNGKPPAPAPAPAQEDLPRAPPAGPGVKKDTAWKNRPTDADDPRVSGGDPTYKALVDALFVLFREQKGADYDPAGRDWKALADLRKRHEGSEIIRRWGVGLQARYAARCSTFWDLRERWNALTAPEAIGGAPVRRPDPNQGITTHQDPLDDPKAVAEANRRQEEWLNGG